MDIKLNGQAWDAASNLICFTGIPNILEVGDRYIYSTKAFLTLTFKENLASTVSGNGQYNITVLGESITNVLDATNAINKNYFISSANTSTAASVAKAFRNCPSIIANFTVM